MVRATLSRAESLRLYFLTLPPSDRAEVLTVRDVRAADILRCMQDMQADGDASGTLLFSFAGAAQRRNLKSYGEWVLASRHLKPSTRDSPSQQALTRHPCPPELMISQRIMEASARTERELRLHFNSTLSVPWHTICDDKGAASLVVDLFTLAPLVSGKEGSKVLLSSCQYFSVASFAASVLLKALVDSYKAAASRHRAASQAGDALAFLSVNAPPARSRHSDTVWSIALLLAAKDKRERVGWEIQFAKAMLKSWNPLLMPALQGGKRNIYSRVTLQSYAGMSPSVHRLDAASELLQMSGAYGHVGQRWSQVGGRGAEGECFHLLIDMMSSAPLAHARWHKTVVLESWFKSCVDKLSALLVQLEGQGSSVARTKELGLSMEEGRFGNGKSIFSSYADTQIAHVQDPLVIAHDDEWTQMGRISEAARKIEAQLNGAHAAMNQMSGGINGSIFFEMAAIEKKLEQKIPTPVYPEMRRKNLVSLPASLPSVALPSPKSEVCNEATIQAMQQETPRKCDTQGQHIWREEERQQAVSEPCKSDRVMSFADMVRKRQQGDSESQAGAQDVSAKTRQPHDVNAQCVNAQCQQPHHQQPHHQVRTPASPQKTPSYCTSAVAWGGAHEAHETANPSPESEVAEERSNNKGVWGRKGHRACSAAQAAQAATGIMFAQDTSETTSERCRERCRESDDAPCVGVGLGVGVTQHRRAWQSSPYAPEASTKTQSKTQRTAASEATERRPLERVRYNPLRPQHASMLEGTGLRCATARRLHAEIEAFLALVEPTNANRRKRDGIVEEVKRAVAASWPNARVEVYGSYATDLFLTHSDVDLLVINATVWDKASAVQVVAERLRAMTWCRYIKTIENCAIPLVKLTADVSLLPLPHTFEAASKPHALQANAALAPPRSPIKVPQQDKEEEEERACIAVDLTFEHNTGEAPTLLRDMVKLELMRFPVIRPLVLVLKHFLLKLELNDVYKGGLSSNALVLLLIFYFNIPEVSAAHEAALDETSEGYIEAEVWYGEWLMRLLQWLSEFPFSDVAIMLQPMSYAPLTDYGYGMLMTGECDPELPDVEPSKCGAPNAEANNIYIQDPFNYHNNIAAGSFEWYLVRRSVQGAYRILCNHQEPSPHLRIFGGVAERASPLASMFDRAHVASAVEAVLKAQAAKRVAQVPRVS